MAAQGCVPTKSASSHLALNLSGVMGVVGAMHCSCHPLSESSFPHHTLHLAGRRKINISVQEE